MNAQTFIAWIRRNADRITHYQRGGDGSGGGCDCIGLIIGAWRLSGNKWPWTHGSNYAARHLVRDLGKDQQLQPGALVFKARSPGESGYDLPADYSDSPDRLDYYHVGVVMAVDPLDIMHCTGVPGGIKHDRKRGAWAYSGQFKDVQYEETTMEKTMIVHSDNGKPVNLRKMASLGGALVCTVPVGSEVTVIGTTSTGWSHIRYGDKNGYMMDKFLKSEGSEITDSPQDETTVDKAREALYQAQRAINDALVLLSPAG